MLQNDVSAEGVSRPCSGLWQFCDGRDSLGKISALRYGPGTGPGKKT